jgi:hypothetical protein
MPTISTRTGLAFKRQRSNINTFGGNVNGPVLKNKLFFAYSYEGIRQSIPDPFTTSIPTPLQRNGRFLADEADQWAVAGDL